MFMARKRIAGVAFILVMLAVLTIGPSAGAQDGSTDEQTVRVATKALAPFVFVDSEAADGSGLTGYSIDVWDEVARRLGLRTEWLVEESVGDILDSARTGDADVAIAGISMTAERETFVDFSHPYYDSGLHLTVRPASGGVWDSLIGLVTSRSVVALAVGLVC